MWRRAARIAVIALAALFLGIGAAVAALTNTAWGRDHVRRIAEHALAARVHGRVRLGALDGNLLRGAVISDFVLTDSGGAPFLAVPRAVANWSLGALLRRRIVLTRLRLDHPSVVLDQPPGGRWNFERLFPPGPTDTTRGFGSWITLHDVRLRGARVTVLRPWAPDSALAPAQRDSAVRAALAGATRVHVVPAPGGRGWQSVMDFRDIDARLPLVRLADPDYPARLVRIAALRMTALPMQPPALAVRDLRGTLRLDADSLWFRTVQLDLPASHTTLTGRYALEPGTMHLDVAGDTLALADLRWLYPPLPAQGGGTAHIALRYSGTGTSDVTAREVHLTTDHATLAGTVGVAFGAAPGDLRLHDTDLRVTGLQTRLLERVVPGLAIPRRGTIAGRARVAGPLRAMRVDADLTFVSPRAGTSRVLARGDVGYDARDGLSVRDLGVRLAPLQVALARSGTRALPVGGTVTGSVALTGALDRRLDLTADLLHHDAGTVSHLTGTATLDSLGRQGLRASLTVDSLALATLHALAPALVDSGHVSGTLELTGDLRRLHVTALVRVPRDGEIAATGWSTLGTPRRVDLSVGTRTLDVRALLPAAPPTTLTASARVLAQGDSTATMRAAIIMALDSSVVSGVALDSARARATLQDGVLAVDTLAVAGPGLHAGAAGTVGIVQHRTGTLRYALHIDSLRALRNVLPGSDTGAVEPRPGRVAGAVARARADSARLARATEVERAALGEPPVTLHVNAPGPLPRDSLAGAVTAAGTVSGGFDSLVVQGTLSAEAVAARGFAVCHASASYGWRRASGRTRLAAGLDADSVQAAGFAFDSVSARAAYADSTGTLALGITADTAVRYRALANVTLRDHGGEVRVRQLDVRAADAEWRAVRPAIATWSTGRFALRDLDLTDGAEGRIIAHATVPDSGATSALLDIRDLHLASVVAMLQSDAPARGIVSARAQVTGTRTAPVIRAVAAVTDGAFAGDTMPDAHVALSYADRALHADGELRNGDRAPLAVLRAAVPVNLALGPVDGSRLLDRPMRVDVRADSLPLAVVAGMMSSTLRHAHGTVFGALAARGTPRHPALAGRFALTGGSVRIVPAGITLAGLEGGVRLLRDSVVIDSLVGRSEGRLALRGGIGLADAAHPSFDLTITGRDALLLDNRFGRLHANADLAIRGPYDGVSITGRTRILDGTLYVPASAGQPLIDVQDPVVYQIIDTTVAANRALLPAPSPLLQRLRVDVSLGVSRDTWVRTTEANVEIYSTGDLRIHLDRASGALTVEGVVNTDRGDYTFLGRRFVLTRGTATFIGDPELNPLLQVAATRDVQVAGRAGLSIGIQIGGTLFEPKITLTSDAQPPIPQSDLLSYLAFGQSSSSLLQLGGTSGISGQTSGSGQLVGQAAGLATRQLAAVAMDVLANQLQRSAGRTLGADVFTITPADIPTDFTLNSVETLLAGTQFEVGKYVDRRTFVVFQVRPTLVAPGLRIQRRLNDGYSVEASIEPRFLLRQPTLSTLATPSPTSVLGMFLARSWRF